MVAVASGAHQSSLVCNSAEDLVWCPICRAKTGITSNELADPTLPSLAELTHGLVQFVASHTPAGAEPVVVAHNSHRFDIKHLRKDLLKRTPAQDLPSNWLILDSYKVVSMALGMDEALGGGSNKLENLLRGAVKDPKREQGHRALGDCRDLCIVLPRMLELGQERGLMVPGSAFARARDIAPIKPKSDSSASGDGDLKRGKISAR